MYVEHENVKKFGRLLFSFVNNNKKDLKTNEHSGKKLVQLRNAYLDLSTFDQ